MALLLALMALDAIPQAAEETQIAAVGTKGLHAVFTVSSGVSLSTPRSFLQDFIFPAYDVRFIAINDNVDSAKGENDFYSWKAAPAKARP